MLMFWDPAWNCIMCYYHVADGSILMETWYLDEFDNQPWQDIEKTTPRLTGFGSLEQVCRILISSPFGQYKLLSSYRR